MKKLNKEELVELARKILKVEYNTEQEGDYLIDLFEYNVPDPYGSWIIHEHPELTPEEIVEKALSYKPIILGPPGNEES